MVSSSSPRASSVMERDRLGEYPECEDEYCPVCGSLNPTYFVFEHGEGECVGCADCTYERYTLRSEGDY